MKDANWTLEFTSHVLANSMHADGERDVFQRDSNGAMIWQQSWWYSAFTKAIELAHIRGIKAADIQVDLVVKADTAFYKRTYGRDEKSRVHEAIFPGTRVTFEAMVADHVTWSSLKAILERMGKYIGLSPYGHRLGFGKFNVAMLAVGGSDAADQQVGPLVSDLPAAGVWVPGGQSAGVTP